jgi:hypothetical protein
VWLYGCACMAVCLYGCVPVWLCVDEAVVLADCLAGWWGWLMSACVATCGLLGGRRPDWLAALLARPLLFCRASNSESEGGQPAADSAAEGEEDGEEDEGEAASGEASGSGSDGGSGSDDESLASGRCWLLKPCHACMPRCAALFDAAIQFKLTLCLLSYMFLLSFPAFLQRTWRARSRTLS